MTLSSSNHLPGSYWRIAWATYWASKIPWTLNGQVMPYIGYRSIFDNKVQMWTFGPIALIRLYS